MNTPVSQAAGHSPLPRKPGTPLLIFMSPKGYQLRGMKEDNAHEPKWFGYTIKHAGFEIQWKPPGFGILKRAIAVSRKHPTPCALIFTVGHLETMAALLPIRNLRFCSFYHWMPFEATSPLKRVCYDIVLRRSDAIVVDNDVSGAYIKERYPRKRVVSVGFFTDTDYFRPTPAEAGAGRFLLCPGDHRRPEEVVLEISKRVSYPVVRFTRHSAVAEFYKGTNVSVEVGVSFDRVRDLYNRALGVINVADDTQIPAGITCFLEALAMDKPIITPGAHSSAGYRFPDGFYPYTRINNYRDAAEWTAAIRDQEMRGFKLDALHRPRKLAEELCSAAVSIGQWTAIRTLLCGTEVTRHA